MKKKTTKKEFSRELRTSDVAPFREFLWCRQGKVDPILKKPLKLAEGVLDHDHENLFVRAVLHRQVNCFEGRVRNAFVRHLRWMTDQSLSEILRNLADYYEVDYQDNPLHPDWLKSTLTEFRRLNAKQQNIFLEAFGVGCGANKQEREKLFKKVQKTNNYKNIKEVINGTLSSDCNT